MRHGTRLIVASSKPILLNTSKRRRRRTNLCGKQTTCALKIIAYAVALGLLIGTAYATSTPMNKSDVEKQSEHSTTEDPVGLEEDEQFLTVHEKQGQQHFASVEYTPYEPNWKYGTEPKWQTMGMSPIHNLTHLFFNLFYLRDQKGPSGYLSSTEGNAVVLGPKFEENDWIGLIASNKIITVWILFLIFLMIITPFIAVCYCCFCCCRCPAFCPPCQRGNIKFARRLLCSILLLVLILLILLGLIIAFLNDKLIDRGFQESGKTMRRSSKDTCAFLKDVNDHVWHLFVNNYQELESHLLEMIHESHTHIFMDVSHISGLYALEELERILMNMQAAIISMKTLMAEEKLLRFHGAQYRDGLRGVKRDLTYLLTVWCSDKPCNNMLRNDNALKLDTSECLHFDKIPDTEYFAKAMEDIIEKDFISIPRRGIARLQKINAMIKEAVEPLIPPLVRDLALAGAEFRNEAVKISDIINAAMSDMYLNNLRTTKSFEDVYIKYSTDRRLVSIIVLLLILLIVIVLIFALILGICVRRDNSGYNCLLLAIVLIYCVFSFLLLVGLFYFMLGWVTYQGACFPRTIKDKAALFRRLDTQTSKNEAYRISNDVKTCREDQNIFKFLRENRLYEVNDLENIHTVDSAINENDTFFKADLSKIKILTDAEYILLDKLVLGNFTNYTSTLYTDNLCNELVPTNLMAFKTKLVDWAYKYFWLLHFDNYGRRYATLLNIKRNGYDIDNYYMMEKTLLKIIQNMRKLSTHIDSLVTLENLNFGKTIKQLINTIKRAENYLKSLGKDFINSLIKNLTLVIQEDIDNYVRKVIDESNNRIGPCKSLAYIYYRGLDLVCYHLVDPINGFWVGLLLSTLLLAPTLLVAHNLLCLFRITVYPAPAVIFLNRDSLSCPTCTGAPFALPPALVCSGGRHAICICNKTTNKEMENKHARSHEGHRIAKTPNREVEIMQSSSQEQRVRIKKSKSKRE